MSDQSKPRSVLSELKKPLIQPTSAVNPELEQRLLGGDRLPPPAPPAPEPPPPVAEPRAKGKAPTVPVTFHLPVRLRDRIKITAQAQQRTMLEIAVEAFESYLDRHPVSEQDLRRLLGL